MRKTCFRSSDTPWCTIKGLKRKDSTLAKDNITTVRDFGFEFRIHGAGREEFLQNNRLAVRV